MQTGFISVYRDKARIRRSRYFEVFFDNNPDAPVQWSVQYCGGGHYFKTLYETLCYAVDRGFIEEHMIDKVTAEIESQLPAIRDRIAAEGTT